MNCSGLKGFPQRSYWPEFSYMSPSTLSSKCHQPVQEKASNAAFEWSGDGFSGIYGAWSPWSSHKMPCWLMKAVSSNNKKAALGYSHCLAAYQPQDHGQVAHLKISETLYSSVKIGCDDDGNISLMNAAFLSL